MKDNGGKCRCSRVLVALAVLAGCASNTPRPSPPGTGVIRLHVESDAPGTTLLGATTCHAPCDREIDGRKGQRFFFRPPDAPDSEPFDTFGMTGSWNAQVDTGSHLRQKGGYVLIGLGGFGILNGLESLGSGAAVRHWGENDDVRQIGKTIQIIGLVSIAAGMLFVAIGIPLSQSGNTTFELTPAPND